MMTSRRSATFTTPSRFTSPARTGLWMRIHWFSHSAGAGGAVNANHLLIPQREEADVAGERIDREIDRAVAVIAEADEINDLIGVIDFEKFDPSLDALAKEKPAAAR